MADVKSTTGQIKFDTQSDNQAEMTLNSTGLGIGVSPSANLHVNGNSIISDQLFVGGSSGSSNLNVNGTLGYGFQTITTSTMLSGNSIVLADTRSGNIVVSLPEASSYEGRKYTIKKTNTLNSVFIRDGGFIDSYSDLTLSVNNMGSLSVISHSGNWHILNISGNGTLLSTDNLVGWWKFDDESGGIATDTSSSGLDATLEGGLDFSTNTISGKLDNALVFDDSDDRITISDNANLRPPQISASLWIQFTVAASTGADMILGQQSSNYGAGGYFLRRNRTAAGSGFSVFIYDGASPEPRVTASTVPTTGEWYHVAFTFDESNIRIYVNGELDGTTARSVSIDYGTGGTFAIGSHPATNAENFPGYLDDVRVYNKVLSEEEIQAIYNQGQ